MKISYRKQDFLAYGVAEVEFRDGQIHERKKSKALIRRSYVAKQFNGPGREAVDTRFPSVPADKGNENVSGKYLLER